MRWKTLDIQTESGLIERAVAPEVISASRATDIPAFYLDWFFHRLKIGHSVWINPFNGKKTYISYQNTRLVVFWSKNPKPLLNRLNELSDRNINCYVQYTLNDYESESLEKNVPPLDERIDTFIRLSKALGRGKVIWRFDPLILTDKLNVDQLLKRIEYIGDKICNYNDHFVFSFADINSYSKVLNNLDKSRQLCREFTMSEMKEFASSLAKLNSKWNFSIGTCAEHITLEYLGIKHNKCIDDELIAKHFSHDKVLMKAIGVEFQTMDLFNSDNMTLTKKNKAKGQRSACGCIESKDVGQYNTCPHLCAYCYANVSHQVALKNYKHYLDNPFSETIIGL